MLYEHLGLSPRVDPTAVIAPTAVVSGDVTIGPGCQVLHGAVISAEGGPITIGASSIVMENALLRASATDPLHIGDHVLVAREAIMSPAPATDSRFRRSPDVSRGLISSVSIP